MRDFKVRTELSSFGRTEKNLYLIYIQKEMYHGNWQSIKSDWSAIIDNPSILIGQP